MDSLDIVFRLLDRVSPTLDVMDRHLASTKTSLGAVDKAIRDLDMAEKRARFANERDPMKRYRVGLELMRDQMTGAKQDAGGAAGSLAMVGGAAGIAAGLAFAAASAFASMARAAVDGAVGLTKFGIEAASFKRDTLTALGLIEGDAKVAEDTFTRLSELSDKTPFKTSDVLTFGKTLRSTGFTIRETEDLLAGMFDVGAVQGKEGPEKVRHLLEGITKIRGRDALNMESLESVLYGGAAAGVNLQSITEAIARGRGTTFEQAKALLHQGQIRGAEGINAILDTIKTKTDQGGPLGKATLEFGRKSLDGQLSTFSSRLESIFYGLDIQPLVNIMQSINDLLSKDSPTGKRIREFATETLGGMFQAAERYLTPANIERALGKVTAALDTAKEAFGIAGSVMSAFVQGFGEGFDTIPMKTDPVRDALDGLNETLGGKDREQTWREFGRSLGLMVDLTVSLGKAILWVNGHLGVLKDLLGSSLGMLSGVGGGPSSASLVGRVFDAFGPRARNPTSFERNQVGAQTAGGLAVGLTDGAAGVNAAAEALARGAIDTTAKTLDIHSPSRVMMRLGGYTAEGFEQGLERGDAERSMRDLVTPEGKAPSASRSWGATVSVVVGDVNVYGAEGNPTRVGREVRASVHAELAALLEELGLSA